MQYHNSCDDHVIFSASWGSHASKLFLVGLRRYNECSNGWWKCSISGQIGKNILCNDTFHLILHQCYSRGQFPVVYFSSSNSRTHRYSGRISQIKSANSHVWSSFHSEFQVWIHLFFENSFPDFIKKTLLQATFWI